MEKKIKAVEMVRKIRDGLYEKTKSMTHKELINFYHSQSETVRRGALKKLQTV